MRLVRQTIVCLAILTVVTGIVYPLIVTGVAQLMFPYQANGSLIIRNGKTIGSSLIGQPFSSPKYFWGRPSATLPVPYNGANSSGSNLGPLNPVLIENVKTRIARLKSADPESKTDVPVDMATASGSGLDPDISLAAAEYQVSRIARERNIDEFRIRELIAKYAHARQLGVLGEPRVTVLELNLALDALITKTKSGKYRTSRARDSCESNYPSARGSSRQVSNKKLSSQPCQRLLRKQLPIRQRHVSAGVIYE